MHLIIVFVFVFLASLVGVMLSTMYLKQDRRYSACTVERSSLIYSHGYFKVHIRFLLDLSSATKWWISSSNMSRERCFRWFQTLLFLQ